jgi:hypothetical protein
MSFSEGGDFNFTATMEQEWETSDYCFYEAREKSSLGSDEIPYTGGSLDEYSDDYCQAGDLLNSYQSTYWEASVHMNVDGTIDVWANLIGEESASAGGGSTIIFQFNGTGTPDGDGCFDVTGIANTQCQDCYDFDTEEYIEYCRGTAAVEEVWQ